MAVRIYETVNAGADLKLWADPRTDAKTDLETEATTVEELQALSDNAKQYLIDNYVLGVINDVDQFDADLRARRDRAKDLVDYFDYEIVNRTLESRDGAWMTPEAVEAFCGEETGSEATRMIDGLNSTWWEHIANEAHQVDLRLRDYRKRGKKIRIRHGTNPREKLDNLTVYFANTLGGLDDAENRVIDNISPVWTEDAWNEFDFDFEQVGQYVRLTGFGSAQASNYVRIREIDVWVETQQYD